MQKIVINTCFGGFGVSKVVYDHLGLKYDGYGLTLILIMVKDGVELIID